MLPSAHLHLGYFEMVAELPPVQSVIRSFGHRCLQIDQINKLVKRNLQYIKTNPEATNVTLVSETLRQRLHSVYKVNHLFTSRYIRAEHIDRERNLRGK